MPKIVFTAPERARVSNILKELDPATHELTAPWSERLDPKDWQFVVDYATFEMRAALELGLLARSAVDTARQRGMANAEGASVVLSSISWLRNFGVIDARDERFASIAGAGTDAPLFLAVEALIEIAKDRLFQTFDEEYRLLLETSR